MYGALKRCSICLTVDSNLISISETDSTDIKWSYKLTFCVPEVRWDTDCLLCGECTRQLNSAYLFRNLCLQTQKAHSEVYSCYVCSANFPEKLLLVDHVQLHSANRCYVCEEQFETTTHLRLHTAQTHGEIQNFHSQQSPFQNAKLDLSPENFKSDEDESDHNYKEVSPLDVSEVRRCRTVVKSRTRSRIQFQCEECQSCFTSSKKLLSHSFNTHGFDPSSIKPFACDKCDSKFSSSSNLLQHKKYHVGQRAHICSYCGKGYITKSDLNTHEKQHLNQREYQCGDCPKTFNTNKNLRSHRLVVHTDPSLWNYVCAFCQKRFPIKSNLDQHTRRHTGDKRFGCHICEKRFVDKVVLQKHVRSHSNVRAFRCDHCGKEYKDDKVLEVHLTKVHGIGNAKVPMRIKKYFCQFCPKAYFAKNKLTRHMFSHTGEKPYVCHICDKKFTDKSYVKQHFKTAHNIFDFDENK